MNQEPTPNPSTEAIYNRLKLKDYMRNLVIQQSVHLCNEDGDILWEQAE